LESVSDRSAATESSANRILIHMDVRDKLKSASADEIVEIIAKLCFRDKTWIIVKDFLLMVKEGMRVTDSRFLARKHHISIPAFYYLRRRLMEMGLIEKTRGKYYLSEKFSDYLMVLADAWTLARKS